jgi:hypothetical protein
MEKLATQEKSISSSFSSRRALLMSLAPKGDSTERLSSFWTMCEAEARPKVRKDKRNFMISVRIESNIGSEKKDRWTLYII